jgi:hypothetical protein
LKVIVGVSVKRIAQKLRALIRFPDLFISHFNENLFIDLFRKGIAGNKAEKHEQESCKHSDLL